MNSFFTWDALESEWIYNYFTFSVMVSYHFSYEMAAFSVKFPLLEQFGKMFDFQEYSSFFELGRGPYCIKFLKNRFILFWLQFLKRVYSRFFILFLSLLYDKHFKIIHKKSSNRSESANHQKPVLESLSPVRSIVSCRNR